MAVGLGLLITGAGGAAAVCEPAGTVLPVRDVVFIVDGSGSISVAGFELELEMVARFVCGDLAPNPALEPFGVALYQFTGESTLEIAYTVIDSRETAADVCLSLAAIVKQGGATDPAPALMDATALFESQALAAQRQIVILTDGGFSDLDHEIRTRSTILRTMAVPVRICLTDISADCNSPESRDLLQEIANSPHFADHVPEQPVGMYACTRGNEMALLLCQDCYCGDDCNVNALADTVEILEGTVDDADDDFLPDECMDCDGNGIADVIDIANGTAADCNENGQIDLCDIGTGLSGDCDGNGVPDECEDCDGSGIGDFCELTRPFSDVSGPLPLDGFQILATHLVPDPPPADGEVTFSFTASANLSQEGEYLRLFLNGQFIENFFEVGGELCTPVSAAVVMAGSNFNALVGEGDAVVEIRANNVFPPVCPDPFIDITVVFDTRFGIDDDRDDRLDACERARGDSNLDDAVNVVDLLAMLTAWGSCGGPASCDADANGDGFIDVADLLVLLANWGSV